jgi:hypothetical protein
LSKILIFLNEEDFNTEAKQLDNDEDEKENAANSYSNLQREVDNSARFDECHV